MASRITVTGLRQLGIELSKLSADMQDRLARRATGRGANVIKTAVVAKAAQQPTLADKPFTVDGITYQPGHIARNVVAVRVRQPEVTSEHVVAVRSNKRNGYAGRIASINEFGTVKMAAQPFMGPGFESSKSEALQTIVETLRKGIKR